jgi:hypothetical protein
MKLMPSTEVARSERRITTMSRALGAGAVALGLLLCGGYPAVAGGALIETTAPLADRSEESVKAAVIAAIDKAVRGASAMGFAWFQLRDAQVTEHEVAVQILATDKDPGEVEEADPGAPPAPPEASTDDGNVTGEPGSGAPVAEASRLHI